MGWYNVERFLLTSKHYINMKTLIFLLFPFFAFGQVVDSTDVTIDTSTAVVMANKIEVSKVGGDFFVKQYNGDDSFTQVTIKTKGEAVKALTQMLKQLKSDEALLLKQLAIIKRRKAEVAAARNLYK